MEAMYGKWETVPSLTENFDAFCDMAEIPQEKREAYRNRVTLVTLEKAGDGMRTIVEVQGTSFKLDLTFEPGVPQTYKGMEGNEVTTSYTIQGDKLIDQSSMVKEGKTLTWETERFIEGDMLVAISKRNGVNVTTKLKRIE